MKTSKKILAVMLTLATLIGIFSCATTVFAEDYNEYAESKAYQENLLTETVENEQAQAEIVCEVEEKREEYSKTYKRTDGSFTSVHSQSPLHKLENGEWKDIDNTLITEDSTIKNTYGAFDIQFPETISENEKITVSNGNESIAFSVNGIENADSTVATPETEETDVIKSDLNKTVSQITYEDIGENTDLQYIVSSTSVKENIIVSNKESLKDAYSFEIEKGDLSATLDNENNLIFKNTKNETAFTIPAPVMTDAQNAVSYDIEVKVENADRSVLTLTYTPSKEWLENKERAYPVTIDPVIYLTNEQIAFAETAMIFDYSDGEDYRNENFYNENLGIVANNGTETGLNVSTSELLIKFNMNYFAELNNPQIAITDVNFLALGNVVGSNILVKEILGNWDAKNITFEDVHPSDDAEPVITYSQETSDYFTGHPIGSSSSDRMVTLNITDLFIKWLTGENNGFSIVAEESTAAALLLGGKLGTSTDSTSYYSYCTVDYVDTSCGNDSFEYLTQEIGRAGSSYVNTFSRGLTMTRNDLSMNGLRMPVSIEFGYNPALNNFMDYYLSTLSEAEQSVIKLSYGNNWLPLNAQGIFKITDNQWQAFTGKGTLVTFNQSEEAVEETDADGNTTTVTKTIFESNDTSDSGYSLELVDETKSAYATNLRLISPDGTATYFNSIGLAVATCKEEADLTDTTDAIRYTYDSANPSEITKITDGVGRQYIFSYSTETGLLSEIKCLTADGEAIKAGTTDVDLKVTYGYDTDGNMTTVTYPDGETVIYTYDSNGNLIKAKNIDDYNIQYTYDSLGKVTNIAEYADSTPGNTIQLTRLSNRQVKVVDGYNGTETYQFGRDGRLHYTFDENGNYYKSDYAPANDENVYSSYDWKITSENRLKNGSFEEVQSAKAVNWSNSFNVEDIETNEVITDYACRVSAIETTNALQSQTIAVDGGNNYTFSLYAKSNLSTLTENDRLYIRVTAEDEEGNETSKSRQITPTENFEQYSIKVSTETEISAITVEFGLKNKTGDFYVNNAQLEKGYGTAPFNYIKNGSFNDSNENWSTATIVDETLNQESVKAVKLSGGLPSYTANDDETYTLTDHVSAVTQNVEINGKKGDIYSVGGWFKGQFDDNYIDFNPNITDDSKLFAEQLTNSSAQIKVTYSYTDTVTETAEDGTETTTEQTVTENFVVDFVAHNDGWQYAVDSFALKGDTESVDVTVMAKNIPADSFATNIALTEDTESSFEEDETEEITEDTEEICSCGCEECYYGENCPCTGAVNDKCQCPECLREEASTQDSFGNTLSNKSTDGLNYIETLSSYTTDGNNIASTTDENGNVVTYDYDILNGILKSVTSPIGTENETTTTNYSYDAMGKVVSISTTVSETENQTLQYVYAKDRLSEIITPNGKYRILYDDWGQVRSVNVVTGSGESEALTPLVEYTYNTGADRTQIYKAVYKNSSTNKGEYTYKYYTNGTLKYVYLNGEQIHFVEYNNLGVLESIENTGGRTVEYTENGTYIYNAEGTCIYSTLTNDDGTVTEENFGVTYKTFAPESDYDSATGISTETEKFEIDSTNRITQETNTDYFGRTQSQNLSVYNIAEETEENPATLVGRINTEYGYSIEEEGKTSSTIEKFVNKTYNGNDESVRVFDGYYYEYDKQNKISAEKALNADGTTTDKYSYEYDKLGQLVRFNDAVENKTYTYTYDNNGNILTKSEYAYTLNDELGTATNTTTYGYDTQWKDKLTSVGDKTIAYDNIGNPTSYLGATLTWEGRQLKSFENDEKLITYEYDENGMRYRTTVVDKTGEENTTVIIDYVWLGEKLVSMVFTEGDSTSLAAKYLYNSSDEVIGFKWVNDTASQSTYYYLKNLQGDITGVVTATGKKEITFSYDAWGKMTTDYHVDSSSPLGALQLINKMYICILNPFGYRGYCLDGYTELYYLQSRYYDPNTGRFINADDTNYLNATGTVLGCNLFAYCENDGVNHIDPRGTKKVDIVITGLKPRIKDIQNLHNNFLCVRLYVWGFAHKKANKTYDFSDEMGSLLKKRLKKSNTVRICLNNLINLMQRFDYKKYTTTKALNFYKYGKKANTSDLDLLLSIGGTPEFKITLKKTNSKTKDGKRIYKVTLKMLGDDFNFESWDKETAHHKNPVVVLINNVGYTTQKFEYFVPYRWKFTVSFKTYFRGSQI